MLYLPLYGYRLRGSRGGSQDADTMSWTMCHISGLPGRGAPRTIIFFSNSRWADGSVRNWIEGSSPANMLLEKRAVYITVRAPPSPGESNHDRGGKGQLPGASRVVCSIQCTRLGQDHGALCRGFVAGYAQG